MDTDAILAISVSCIVVGCFLTVFLTSFTCHDCKEDRRRCRRCRRNCKCDCGRERAETDEELVT